MKKLTLLILTIPAFAMADNVATTAAFSTLQGQVTQLQQQVQSMQQNLNSTTTGIGKITGELGALQKQINQYGNTALTQFKWIDVSSVNQVPQNAFVAAENNGSPLYVCQAAYSNGSGYYGGGNNVIDPGVVSKKGCVITYSGQAYLVPQYSVLTSNVSGYWVSGDLVKTNKTPPPVYPVMMLRENGSSADQNAPAPSNEPTPLYNALAIIGGQENGTNVYIYRVKINNQCFVGKAVNNSCYIATGRYEASWPIYEVLLTRKP